MTVFELQVMHELTPEMEALRMACFPIKGAASRDAFDERSRHAVLVHRTGRVVGYARFTQCPNGVFWSCSHEARPISNDPSAIDLGRCLIKPEYRGHLLMEVLVLCCLQWVKDAGFEFVNGAIKPGRHLNQMIYDVGFQDRGLPVAFTPPSEVELSLQLVTCPVEVSFPKWPAMLARRMTGLESLDRQQRPI